MQLPNFEVKHGRFVDLSGVPRKYGDVTFAAAEAALFGTMFEPARPFEEWLAERDVSPETRMLIRPGEDAVWVRGRAQRLFDIPDTTGEDRGEKTFFVASLVAILEGEDGKFIVVPFQCEDYYGRSALIFSSEDGPPDDLQDRIASTFWGLLLSEPRDLEDYRDTILHPGAGVWLDFGVEDGEPFLDERE